MQIHGLNKTTLLDYPGHVAATIFLGRCNFCCPFCQNGDLVLSPEKQPVIEEEEVLDILRKRQGILTGVCITGGEPTLERDLEEFIGKVRDIGYLVKLDTNGYRPEVIERLLQQKMLDYIAMDIKHSIKHYGEAAGSNNIDTEKIQKSIHLIMESGIDYEFRTTVVKELHKEKDFIEIGKEIEGAKAYFLQKYQESEAVIRPGYHAYEKEKMEEFAKLLKSFVPNVKLRGIE